MDSSTIIAQSDKTYTLGCLFFLKNTLFEDFCENLGVLLLLLVWGWLLFCFVSFCRNYVSQKQGHSAGILGSSVLDSSDYTWSVGQDGSDCSCQNQTGNDCGLLPRLSFLSEETLVWCQCLFCGYEERDRAREEKKEVLCCRAFTVTERIWPRNAPRPFQSLVR